MSVKYQFSKDVTIPYVLRNLKHLTFPPFERKIASSNISGPFLCVQAVNEYGEVIGVALADSDTKKPFAEVISLFTRPDHQNQGIATQLLEKIAKASLASGQKQVRIFFRSNWNSRDKIMYVLNKLKWSFPKPIMQIYKSNIREFGNVRWPMVNDLPIGYSLTLWAEMSEDDVKYITHRMEQEKIEWYLSPFENVKNIERSNSLILRHKEMPVGWLVVYRNGFDSLEYNNLFIFKEHRKSARIPIVMIYRALSTQLEKNIPECTWIVSHQNRPMIAYVERYFGKVETEKVSVYVAVYPATDKNP